MLSVHFPENDTLDTTDTLSRWLGRDAWERTLSSLQFLVGGISRENIYLVLGSRTKEPLVHYALVNLHPMLTEWIGVSYTSATGSLRADQYE